MAEEGRPKRERKAVEHFQIAETATVKEVKIPEGSGTVLGEFEFFVKGLEKHKGDDELVKILHSLLFGTIGKKLEAKKNIRKFKGFAEDTNKDDKVTKVTENKKKWTVQALKDSLGLFGLEKSGSREELIVRLVDYLIKPSVTKSVDEFKSAKKAAGSKKTPSKKRKAKGSKSDQPKKKRTPSAFLLFSSSVREEVKKENPEAAFGEIGKLLGARWQALDVDTKKVWTDKAAELKGSAGHDEETADEKSDDEEEEGEDLFGEETEDEIEERTKTKKSSSSAAAAAEDAADEGEKEDTAAEEKAVEE